MSTVCHHSPDLISVNHSLMNSVSQWSSRQTESVVFKCSFPRIILPDESDCIIRRKDNLFYGDPSCIRCRGRLPVLPPVEHLQPVEDLGDQRLKKKPVNLAGMTMVQIWARAAARKTKGDRCAE